MKNNQLLDNTPNQLIKFKTKKWIEGNIFTWNVKNQFTKTFKKLPSPPPPPPPKKKKTHKKSSIQN